MLAQRDAQKREKSNLDGDGKAVKERRTVRKWYSKGNLTSITGAHQGISTFDHT
jgi:hypothetical protein